MSGSKKRDEGIDLTELVAAASRRVASQRLVSGTLSQVQKDVVIILSQRENNSDIVTERKMFHFFKVTLSQLIKKITNSATSDTDTITKKYKDAYISSRK